MKELLKKLTAAFGPSGHEGPVRALIEEEIRPYVDEMRTDAMGNLIALRHGSGAGRIMLAAHMDQIGFIVTDADKKGFLRISPVGGIRRPYATGRRVVFQNGVSGIVAREIEGDDPKDMTLGRLFIDIGASDRNEALSMVQIGDMAVYAPDWAEMANDMVAGPAMDDRSGCALLVQALKEMKDCPNEIAAVFTVQEEVGLRGAKAAAYDVNPTMGLAIDVTPAGGTPKGEKLPVKVGEGIAVKVMDHDLICTPKVVAELEDAAEKNGIKYQREVLENGGTDAAPIYLTRAGVPTGVISIPCRYIHSAGEVVSMKDMRKGVNLLTAMLCLHK